MSHITDSFSTSIMSSSNELVPSGQERSLNRQVVLEEDEYTAAMSHIIARDFFPSLVHLDATNDYLDALRSGDTNLISATVRRLEDINTPYVTGSRRAAPDTPYGAGPSDTPLRTPRGEGPPNKRPRLDKDLRLDEFQARYTSEDNSSFTQILNDENEKRKEMWFALEKLKSEGKARDIGVSNWGVGHIEEIKSYGEREGAVKKPACNQIEVR